MPMVPFEFCHSCFALRHVQSGLYVGKASTVQVDGFINSAEIQLKREPQWMYRVRGGTWNFPGDYTESIILGVDENGRRKSNLISGHSSSSSSSSWTWFSDGWNGADWCQLFATQPNDECSRFLWQAHTPDVVDPNHPDAVGIFTCVNISAGSTSVASGRTCALGNGGGAGLLIPLVNGDSDASYNFECDQSCGAGLTGKGGAERLRSLLVFLALFGSLPALFWCAAQRACAPSTDSARHAVWPKRKRPVAVFAVFFVSWAALLLGITPLLMWVLFDDCERRHPRVQLACPRGAMRKRSLPSHPPSQPSLSISPFPHSPLLLRVQPCHELPSSLNPRHDGNSHDFAS